MQIDFDNCLDWFSTSFEEAVREFDVERPDLSDRNPYQRDRDRIIASKAFCRLDGKAQVFYADSKDHIRNRLTHSLGVKSLADNIARKLLLNCDLTEAIALSHDLGHTPYGHIGERVLNQTMNGCVDIHGVQKHLRKEDLGFKHNWQGFRIVTELATHSDKYPGLNLTKQTIWGIVNHTGLDYKACVSRCLSKSKHSIFDLFDKSKRCKKVLSVEFYKKIRGKSRPRKEKIAIPLNNIYWTPEAMVVAVADEIDQRTHDVSDALEFGIVGLSEIVKKFCETFSSHFTQPMNEIVNSLKEMCFTTIDSQIGDYSKSIKEYTELMESIVSHDSVNLQIVQNASSCLLERTAKTSSALLSIFSNAYNSELKSGSYHVQATLSRLIADLYINNFVILYKKKMQEFVIEHNIADRESYKKRLMNGQIPFLAKDLREDAFWVADEEFHGYLKSLILNCHKVQLADGRASLIIRKIFKALVSNPMQLPDKVLMRFASTMDNVPIFMTESIVNEDVNATKSIYSIRSSLTDKYLRDKAGNVNSIGYAVLMRTICDFISGMTDQFAESYYHELYGVNDIMLEFK